MSDFIETFPEALGRDYCLDLVRRFEQSRGHTLGRTGQGIDLEKKDSLDLSLATKAEFAQDLNHLATITLRHLVTYVRKYPFLILGAVATSIREPHTGTPQALTLERVPTLDDAQIAAVIRHVYRLGDLNVQRYKKGKGGYHHFHSEVFPHPHNAEQDSLHRVLFFMYYLNDVERGGETSFYFQGRKIRPAAGTLLIAPGGFTHTHKGHVPLSDDKYIVTSWVLFQRAEKLYAAGG